MIYKIYDVRTRSVQSSGGVAAFVITGGSIIYPRRSFFYVSETFSLAPQLFRLLLLLYGRRTCTSFLPCIRLSLVISVRRTGVIALLSGGTGVIVIELHVCNH